MCLLREMRVEDSLILVKSKIAIIIIWAIDLLSIQDQTIIMEVVLLSKRKDRLKCSNKSLTINLLNRIHLVHYILRDLEVIHSQINKQFNKLPLKFILLEEIKFRCVEQLI